MEFYDVIGARRTVRELKEEPVPGEVLERILAAGLKAPTNNHLREWEFVVLGTREEKKNGLQFVKAFVESLGERPAGASSSIESQRNMYAYAIPRQYSMLMKSGCVVLPFFKAAPLLLKEGPLNSRNSLAGVWCCIENILLAAAAEGLACSLRIPVGNEGERVAEVIHAPEGYMLPCYIGIGYPAGEAAVLEQIEPQVKDVLHFGKW